MDSTVEPPTSDAPGPQRGGRRGGRKGRGSWSKGQEKFRQKHNNSFHQQLRAETSSSLKLLQPTLSRLQTVIKTLFIRITFIGLPALLDYVWNRMFATGGQGFRDFVANHAHCKMIFQRTMLRIASCKLAYAHRRATSTQANTYGLLFPQEVLELYRSLAIALPFPVVMYLDAIGFFELKGKIVPILRDGNCLETCEFSALTTFFCGNHTQADAQVRAGLNQLFGLTDQNDWIIAANGDFTASAVLQNIWQDHFGNDVAQVNIIKNMFGTMMKAAGPNGNGTFLVSCTIDGGKGTDVQLVRFPEQPVTGSLKWYCNADIDEYSKEVASTMLLGYEFGPVPNTRFTSTYEESQECGHVTREQVLNEVIWSGYSS